MKDKTSLLFWIGGSVVLAVGLGRLVVNVHETNEALRWHGMFRGLVEMLGGAVAVLVGWLMDKRSEHEE